MGLIGRLFGKDPTKEWPSAPGQAPAFDLERGTLGGARFGDPFEKLKVLGRPDALKGDPAHVCDLYYDAAGFEVAVELGKFAGVTFTLSPHATPRKKLLPGMPSIGGLRMSAKTRPEDVTAWFGEPTESDGDGTYRTLQYERAGNWMVLDFEEEDGLRSVDCYPND